MGKLRFLTWDQIRTEYSTFAWTYEELPEHAKRAVHPLEPDRKTYDFATCLREGWQWMFDGWRRWQPKAYAALETANPALIYAERFWPDRLDPKRLRWGCDGFVRFGERYLLFFPYFKDRSIEQAGADHPAIERFNALPEAIAQAYYARIGGVGFTDELPMNLMNNRVLPAWILTGWADVTQAAEGAGVARKTVVSALRQLAGGDWSGRLKEEGKAIVSALRGLMDRDLSSRWEERFLVMLDTRAPGDFKPRGDIVFLDEESASRRLYHMHDFDASNIALLGQPGEAIDSYVAYVISGAEAPFDFSRYRTPV
jgi:hypothetical protein